MNAMNNPTNVDIHLLSGAYALDALAPTERTEFEAHLAICTSCRDEVAGFHETGAMIASTTAEDPSPELRERVLGAISSIRPLPPLEPATASEPTPVPPTPVTTLHPRRWWAAPLLVAAVTILVVGLTWRPWTDSPTAPRSEIQAVLAASDVQRYDQLLASGGKVTLYRSVSLDRSAAVASDLPALPDGQVYELWYQDPTGSMVPAGLLPDSPHARLVLDGSAAEATAAGITVEPAGGSEAPTTNPVALFGFTQN